MDIEPANNVTKSNSLIRASYKLTLNEQRLVLLAISQLDPRKPLSMQPGGRNRRIRVTAQEFADHFDIELKHAYTALRDATNNLFERDIKTYDGKARERFRWIDYVQYVDSEGSVELSFTIHIAPYITELTKNFTKYKMQQIANVKSVYSIRLFELIKQFDSTGICLITLADFKSYLDLTEKYPRFADLRKNVIAPAVKELNEKSGMIINWDSKRKDRKIHSLSFTFEDNPQESLAL